MKKVKVGIDIGGTSTKFGIVDLNGNVLFRNSISSKTHSDVRYFMDDLSETIDRNLKELGTDVVLDGIGIGAPNGNIHQGTIEHAPNLVWKGIVPFIELFKDYYDVPMVLTNDANAAALGELLYGAAKDMKDFIVLTLGTGLGGGIVSGGKLLYGHNGFAGELGHITVNPVGRHCGCGKRGCLETYVSATGIKRTVYKLLADFTYDSTLRGISFDNLSAEMITKEAINGDKIALEAFEYTGQILGTKLADFIIHTDPEAIFLSGGLANAGDFIFKPALRVMEESVMPIFRGKVKLLPSGLNSQDAAIIGASSLIGLKM